MSRALLIDASVALKLALANEEFTAETTHLFTSAILLGYRLVVPPHFHGEVVNVLYQRTRTTRVELRLPLDDAAAGIAGIESQPFDVVPRPPSPLALHLAVRFNLPSIYDALYLATAEQEAADLWTDDRRLLKALGGSLPHVRWIGDYRPGALAG